MGGTAAGGITTSSGAAGLNSESLAELRTGRQQGSERRERGVDAYPEQELVLISSKSAKLFEDGHLRILVSHGVGLQLQADLRLLDSRLESSDVHGDLRIGVLFVEGCLFFLWQPLFELYWPHPPERMEFWISKMPILIGTTIFGSGIYMGYVELINMDTDTNLTPSWSQFHSLKPSPRGPEPLVV